MSRLDNPIVLILDDDELWLARHERRLRQAGFETFTTEHSKEALKVLKTNPAIKFALIDEILYVPPIPLAEEEKELQNLQGEGVIREINKQRADVQFIIVSAAPYQKSGEDIQVLLRETARLRRHPGVLDIIHKLDIQENPQDTYEWIIDLLKRSRNTTAAKVIRPKILIGLGFTKEEHETMAEQMEIKRKQYMPIAPLLKKAGNSKILENFFERAKEKSIFLEMPGMKKPDKLKEIKSNSSAFKILSFLAQQSERKEETLICEEDYKHFTRHSKKKGIDIDEDSDDVANRAFAFGYDHENKQGSLNDGVQIEQKNQNNSALKVAISRLSKKLQDLNVGPSKQLFYYDSRGYKPTFELSIVVFAIRSSKR
ncbi:MAG: hypothetical protein AAGD25_16005 [Cyanobacteria bacterium P01_F01_bin.150]